MRTSLKPSWFRIAEGLAPIFFCEAELRFLLLFLEKGEYFSITMQAA
jgi:hypothetical protein